MKVVSVNLVMNLFARHEPGGGAAAVPGEESSSVHCTTATLHYGEAFSPQSPMDVT